MPTYYFPFDGGSMVDVVSGTELLGSRYDFETSEWVADPEGYVSAGEDTVLGGAVYTASGASRRAEANIEDIEDAAGFVLSFWLYGPTLACSATFGFRHMTWLSLYSVGDPMPVEVTGSVGTWEHFCIVVVPDALGVVSHIYRDGVFTGTEGCITEMTELNYLSLYLKNNTRMDEAMVWVLFDEPPEPAAWAAATYNGGVPWTPPGWPWRTVAPDADPPDVGEEYGATDVFHAYVFSIPTAWNQDGSPWIRTTGEAAYFDLATEAWVYDGAREIHCRCADGSAWVSARLAGVTEEEGIYAVLYEGDYYWYVGDPTRPGEDVYCYCLATGDTPPVTAGSFPWTVGTFELWVGEPI